MIRMIIQRGAVPIVLSVIGSAYFGYLNASYSGIIVWVLVNTGFFLWWARPSFQHAFDQDRSTRTSPPPIWFVPVAFIGITLSVGAILLAAQSTIYFLVLKISN